MGNRKFGMAADQTRNQEESMEKLEQLYEGKAKKVFRTDNEDLSPLRTSKLTSRTALTSPP